MQVRGCASLWAGPPVASDLGHRRFNTFQRAVESKKLCLGSFPVDLCYTPISRTICATGSLCFGVTELRHQAQGFTPASLFLGSMLKDMRIRQSHPNDYDS